MVYVTVKQSPMYKQMSLEDFLFSSISETSLVSRNSGNTRTYKFEETPLRLANVVNKQHLIKILSEFNASTEYLRERDRKKLYYSFFIPKRNGGRRRIDAPNFELMDALRQLKKIFENDFGVLYHTSAFAYIKGRSTIDCVKRHQSNESRWFGKFDLSNFFGSTTLEFVMQQLSMIYPISEVVKVPEGRTQLEKALELAFLNGGLPQGTPISPLISNLIMIPIDHKLFNTLRDFEKNRFVYTRYADDFIISSKYDFNFRGIESLLIDTMAEFSAPFSLNREKTRYGSSAGKNYNLGVLLNKDNQITVGNARKRMLIGVLNSYIWDIQRGERWPLEDVQVLAGQLSYYRMVEQEAIDGILRHVGEKASVDIMAEIKRDLK